VKKLPSIIVVCGPTATGKSDKAVELALAHQGEIISCDSRQVYKGLDLGSGKITKKEMRGVPHYMLDVVSPLRTYSVAQFQKRAQKYIESILKRGKVPILCGGTGFYMDALIFNTQFPEVPANKKLRSILEHKTAEELFSLLQARDKTRAKKIDRHNKVRLIRALEIVEALGAVPRLQQKKMYTVTCVYLDFPDDMLKERIHVRLHKRIKCGMIAEAKHLHANGMSWKRMERLGLEYKYLALLLQKKITRKEFEVQLENAIWQYVKRQRTWFKKYENT
jgi:tRNA dimethylallyltransferase